MNTAVTPPRPATRWGRSRLGGGSALLLLLSLVLGLLIASCLGALLALFSGERSPWLAFTVGVIITLPAAVALSWAVFVDWSTVAGRVNRPEESIESVWYGRAATGVFHDLLMILGLGAAAFSITRLTVDTGMLLIVLCGLVMIDFAVRYRVAAREGR